MTAIRIYAGLSIASDRARAELPGAEVRPPVARGDVPRALVDGCQVLVVIDGRFQQSLAVSVGELMDALRGGCRIYGASSMGALRAAELHRYGMIGVGEIFELVRSSPGFRDDWLAQAFVEHEDGAGVEGITRAHVDLAFSLQRLHRRGVLAAADLEVLLAASEATPYARRSLAGLWSGLEARGEARAELRAALEAAFAMESQKTLDAIAVLRAVAADLAEVARLDRAINGGEPG